MSAAASVAKQWGYLYLSDVNDSRCIEDRRLTSALSFAFSPSFNLDSGMTTPLCIEFVVASLAAEVDGGFSQLVNAELQALVHGFGMIAVREVFF
jgi:hypothetical protein